jgi:hypothetical protein
MFFFMLDGLESKKNLYELFDIFVGVSEDKYNNTIEGIDSPAFLLRLSSINEYDNTIRHRNELIENEKKIDLFRSRRLMNRRTDEDKMNIPYKFLLREDDYIITNRGITRIVSMRKALELDTKVDHFAATQQFLYLRPKEITKGFDAKYVDILIETLTKHLNLKQDYSKDTIIKLKEGHTLNFIKFEVGQPVSITNKINGANEKIIDGTYSGYIIDNKKESRIRFKTKDGVIIEITKSLINVITVKELEAIELNISENLLAQQALVKEYEKVYYGLENAKRSFEIFTTELTDKFIAK